MKSYNVCEYKTETVCDADGNFIKKKVIARAWEFPKKGIAECKYRSLKAQGRDVSYTEFDEEYPF